MIRTAPNSVNATGPSLRCPGQDVTMAPLRCAAHGIQKPAPGLQTFD